MRPVLLACALAATVGCTRPLAIDNPSPDGSVPVTPTTGTTTGGTGGTTGVMNGGGMIGDGCMTACDCTVGLACRMGKCDAAPFGPVYCCESTLCPDGARCQSMDGHREHCGDANGMTG